MSEDRVEAVERALTILEAFREGEEALSLAALAEKTGFYKSTILRLAASLERFGYLARTPTGLYRLGPSLWRLGSLYRRSFDPVNLGILLPGAVAGILLAYLLASRVPDAVVSLVLGTISIVFALSENRGLAAVLQKSHSVARRLHLLGGTVVIGRFWNALQP